MEDSRIIELYFQRNESAIYATDEKYGAYLNQVSYNILRDACETEEIVNDTYMGAWNAIPPTKPNVLKHFLSKITRNLSFSRLDHIMAKKRNANATLVLSELDECIPDTRNDIERVWEVKEIGASLNRFLASLDKQKCAIFLARYYYAYTVLEIAKKYGLSERRVKYLLAKIRTSLKEHLGKDGVIL